MKSLTGTLVRVSKIPAIYLLFSGMILVAGMLMSTLGAALITLWPRVIIGLLVFLLPGCYLYVLAPTRDDWDLIEVIGYGFTYSIVLITVLGLITRTLAWSIDTVEFVWYALGLLGGGAVAYKMKNRQSLRSGSSSAFRQFYLLLAILFVLLTLYIHASVHLASNSDDQNLHLATIQGFLRSEPLGWSEPYYETGNRIAYQYFLDYWVLAQALVAEISSVHILLVRYLINPFALMVSVSSMYIFARNLGHCRRMSLSVVIVGMLALSLISWKGNLAGNQFFVHVNLDKVLSAFALAPVAISSAWLYAQSGSHRALLGFGLSFLACSFVHSVIGGYVLCIIGLWCLLHVLTNRRGRQRIYHIAFVFIILFIPSILMRLDATQPSISPIGSGDWFFGINPRQAGLLTYIVILLTAICAAARRDARGRLMLSFVIVIGVGLFPLTAWAYRVLLPENQINRLVWLVPYGYMIVFVMGTAWRVLAPRASLQRVSPDRLRIPLLILAVPITAYFLQFYSRADFGKDIGIVTEEVSDLLEVATYIDIHHDDRVWIAPAPGQDFRNKTVTLHWKVISLSRFSAERMAYYSNIPLEQAKMQRADNFRLYDAAVPVEEKLAIIDRYDIDYLLFPKEYSWMVDALYQTDKQRFELVYSGESLRLVRVHY